MPIMTAHILNPADQIEDLRQRRHIDREQEQRRAKEKCTPNPWILSDFVFPKVRLRNAHIEDVPQLSEGKGQEGDGDRGRGIEL